MLPLVKAEVGLHNTYENSDLSITGHYNYMKLFEFPTVQFMFLYIRFLIYTYNLQY